MTEMLFDGPFDNLVQRVLSQLLAALDGQHDVRGLVQLPKLLQVGSVQKPMGRPLSRVQEKLEVDPGPLGEVFLGQAENPNPCRANTRVTGNR